MGYFYWLRVKSSNHLHTDLSLGYPKDTKFYLESNKSFIYLHEQYCSMFFIAWLREYALFRTVPWLAWSPRLGQNIHSWELFSKKRSCSIIKLQTFSSSNMFFIRLFLVTVWWKNRGSPCSFKRKGEFISPSSLVWRKSLMFCSCTRSCARATDTKIRAVP